MNFELAVTLVSVIAIFLIGIIVYLHDKKSISNILFFLISLVASLLSIANYFSITASAEQNLYWIRLVLFFAAPMAVLFFIFVFHFPREKLIMKRKYFYSIIILLILTMTATVSPYVFTSIETYNNAVTPIPGILMPLFITMVVGSLLLGIFKTVINYLKAENLEKKRWLYILVGVIISYLLLILTNFIFVVYLKDTSYVVYGPIFILPTLIGAGYAVVKHKLLNVRVITTEILIFSILFFSLFEILISDGLIELLIRIVIFLILFIFSVFLVRSVIKEVEQREELQKLSAELYKTNQKLKELDLLKTEFLSITSHQLRTPLSGIKGYLSMMADGDFGPFSEEQSGIINRVKAEVDRLVRMVQDFLNVSHIESGRLDINKLEFNIVEVVKTVIKELEPSAKARGLKLSLDTAQDNIQIKADQDKLKDVIMNLTDNAIKYTEKGKVWLEINCTQDKQVKVAVHDTGVGVDPAEIDKLFSKFKRAKGITKVSPGGTGLGLFIAKKIVGAHKGEIWAESQGKGRGAAFIFKIPSNC